ncbi:MAG: L-threonylcarbamoyladenylate synthase, partial [Anaeroplasmataceae bacterium]
MNKIIIFPTDTVYGIGCSVYDRQSIQKIYEIKNRDLNKPLAVLCSSLEQINSIAIVDELSNKLISKFLPGPLSVILKANQRIKEVMNLEYIAVRIPNHKQAINLLNEFGPLATTSVNESGTQPLNEYELIVKDYLDKVDHIYKDELLISSNLASTVVKIENSNITLI